MHLKTGRTIILWATILTGIVACAYALYHLTGAQHAAAAIAKQPVPYTVLLQNSGSGTTMTQAVRSDGSRVTKITKSGLVERVIELVPNTQVTTMDLAGKMSTMPNSSADPRNAIRDPATDCILSIMGNPVSSGEFVAGHQTISSYRAVKIMNGDDALWFALDYGCAIVQSQLTSNGKVGALKTVVSLVAGEPSQDLFSLTGLQEVPPSNLLLCAACDPATKAAQLVKLHKKDAEYYAHNGKRSAAQR